MSVRSLVVLLVLMSIATEANSERERGRITYKEQIDEETPIGTVVLQLNATKHSRLHQLILERLSNLTNQTVTLSSVRFRGTSLRDEFRFDGPLLSVARRLDRETLCQTIELERACPCSGTCEYLIEHKAEAFQQEVSIDIVLSINDINDHEPAFVENGLIVNHTVLKIPENSKKHVIQLSACVEDPDSRFGFRNYLLVNYTSSIFKVIPNAQINRCAIRIELTQPLDREAAQHHRFTIVAQDSGSPPKTGTLAVDLIVKDDNDNAPQFTNTSFVKEVREDFYPSHTDLLRLEATDADADENGQVSYRFDRPQESFAIDSNTGQISVTRPLDYETKRKITLVVIAEDNASELRMSATAVVVVHVIDINDTPPDIKLFDDQSHREPEYLSVTENEAPRTAGYLTVWDADFSGSLNFTCDFDHSSLYDSKAGTNYFQLEFMEIQQNNAITYRIKMISPVDQETVGPQVSLTVECVDLLDTTLISRKQVRVRINDVNDNPPRFLEPKYSAQIRENNNVSMYIVTLTYYDLDQVSAPVRFEVTQLQPNRTGQQTAIRVDSDGRVYAAQKYNREQYATYEFLVTIFDVNASSSNETTRLTMVILDDNDCTPQFDRSEYIFEHPEETFTGSAHYIGKLSATDCDVGVNQQVSLSIDGMQDSPFSINNNNGDMHAMRPLDREQQQEYILLVTAVDNGTPQRSATARVIVRVLDKNDHIPVFSETNYVANISVHAPAGSRVTSLTARDADEPNSANARVRYSFSGISCSALLSLDAESGEVRLRRTLTQADAQTLNCIVQASDSALPPKIAKVSLTVTFSNRAEPEAPRSAALPREEEGYERFIVLLVASVSVVVLTVLSLTVLLLLLRKYRFAARARKRARRNPRPAARLEHERPYGSLPPPIRGKLVNLGPLPPACQLCLPQDVPRPTPAAADDYRLLRLREPAFDDADCFRTPSVASDEKRMSTCSCESPADENDNEPTRTRMPATIRCSSRTGTGFDPMMPRSTSFTNSENDNSRMPPRADSRCCSILDRSYRPRERDRDLPQYAVLTLPRAENTFV